MDVSDVIFPLKIESHTRIALLSHELKEKYICDFGAQYTS